MSPAHFSTLLERKQQIFRLPTRKPTPPVAGVDAVVDRVRWLSWRCHSYKGLKQPGFSGFNGVRVEVYG